jgi:hypothetical protein
MMKRFGKLVLLAVLIASLFVSVVAISVSADPVHVGGGPRLASSGDSYFDDGVTTLCSPVHVGGG